MRKTRAGRVQGVLGIFLVLSLLAGAILVGVGYAADGSTPPDLTTNPASAVDNTSATLNGFVTSLGTAPSVNVTFQWGLSTSYTYETALQNIGGTVAFSASISSLSAGTTYHFRAKAVGNGTSYGADMTFTTTSTPPAVTTNAADNVTATSATLNGNLTSMGTASPVQVSLQWGLSTSYGSETPMVSMTSTGTFNAGISGLSPGLTYHFRAKGVGAGATVYGSDMTFTALSTPMVSTNPAGNVGNTSATLNGFVTSLGLAPSVNVSFQWGTSTSYAYETALQNIGSTVAFSGSISSLSPGTTYHFRAKAVDNGTPYYGSDMTFITSTVSPAVTTNAASAVTTISATLNGDLTSLGTAAPVQVSFQWGLSTSYTSETPMVSQTSTGTFNASLSSLSPGTTYHFRAKAVGAATVYGSDMTFTTLIIPMVSTNPASSVATSSATLNGFVTSLGTALSVDVSFQWGLTTSYAYETAPQSKGTGAFSASISSLSPGTTYHFRAKAVGNATPYYGSDMTFVTSTITPAFTSKPASAVTTISATLNGNLTSLGTAAPVQVSFQWGLTSSYTNETTLQGMTSTGTFSAGISSLSPSTTYHFRAKAVGAGTSYYSYDVTFITSSTPVVTTNVATIVNGTSATLNGYLTSRGTASKVQVSFQWGLTSSYGTETTPGNKTGPGTFNAGISSLSPGTTYHFRAKAVGNGTSYGSDMTFTTTSTPPSVTTNAANNITTTTASLNGNITSLGTASTVQRSFEWGLTTAYGSETPAQTGNTTGTFQGNITGLSPCTTYHFRAKAVGAATVYGSDTTFTTLSAPAVSTNAASSVTSTSATLNGYLTSLGTMSPVQVSFQWGPTTGYGTETLAYTLNGNLTAPGAFQGNITGLTLGTTYHFRAKAVGNSTSYGSDMTLTTTSTMPTIATIAASAVTATSATLNGNLTSLGTAATVQVSFQWGLTTAYGSETPAQTGNTTRTFQGNITGLSPGTTYHFRAKAVGSGTYYSSSDRTFTTLATPAVTTNAAGNVTNTSATLNGSLTSLGTASPVQVSFQWGLTTGYGTETPAGNMTATGAFQRSITGLSQGTTYHFRAKAVGNGTSYGSDMTFTTTSTPPEVTTNAANNITTTTASLNGNITSLGTASTVQRSFQWGLTTAYGSETPAQTGNTTGTFQGNITSLSPGTTYHFRAKAVGAGTAYGSDMTFTTLATPVVSTNAANPVANTSATLNGSLTSLGTASPVQVSFQWGLTTGYGTETPAGNLTTPVAFQGNITGLTQGTTYHFRAKAAGNGTSYGSDMTFATTSIPPSVTTNAADNRTTTTASLNGNLTSLGTASTVQRSFQWGLTTAYGSETPAQTGNTTGTFQGNITGLSPCTTYHFRAKAVGTGTVYGSDTTFTTPCTPVVGTTAASSVGNTSATLNGYLTSLGDASPVRVSFQWGLTTGYGSETPSYTQNGNLTAPGAFQGNITGLTQGTTYHFRAKAAGNGTSYGSDKTFATTGGASGGTATADSKVMAQSPTTNYGTATSFDIQAYDSSNRQRGLIQFDLSGIPSGSTINSATFSAYYYSYFLPTLDPAGRTYYLYRNTGTWTETGVTWNNQPAYTTSQGANVAMPASFGWVSWNAKDIVQTWVNGAINYGFVMMDSNETQGINKLALFYSKEYADDLTLRPKLVIDYAAPP